MKVFLCFVKLIQPHFHWTIMYLTPLTNPLNPIYPGAWNTTRDSIPLLSLQPFKGVYSVVARSVSFWASTHTILYTKSLYQDVANGWDANTNIFHRYNLLSKTIKMDIHFDYAKNSPKYFTQNEIFTFKHDTNWKSFERGNQKGSSVEIILRVINHMMIFSHRRTHWRELPHLQLAWGDNNTWTWLL